MKFIGASLFFFLDLAEGSRTFRGRRALMIEEADEDDADGVAGYGGKKAGYDADGSYGGKKGGACGKKAGYDADGGKKG
eukprot:CAMPEP_0194180440 /NCGR_PEP_ID=MMETSP0154-20130528/16900_1 /TAXON_ID=1049557 /ORGANISM="Thalassiothrix antarctica, Strain L6-D1" /LENGTH=78 /DNA_ID=CAMNT_0038896131 /DNA_START=54 /DNA_END=286 /DNA_ORIENTATION=+